MVELDVRGYSRGIPLIKVQQTVAGNPRIPITIYTDTAWSAEDITRYVRKKGYSVEKSGKVGDYKLVIKPNANG